MVKIIDGEICADDDPRVQQAQRRAPAAAGPAAQLPAAGGARPAANGGSVFDWSQPALRLMAGQDGRSLPDLRIFGALMVGQHALMIAAAMLFMGLKGLALGCLVWWMYTSSAAGQEQQPTANQGQRMAAAQDYFSRMMGQAPLGRSGAPAAGSGNGAGQTARPPSAAQDHWAGRGRARKLTDPS